MRQPVKYYVDEHVATAVVRGLRQRGADVLTVSEGGLRGAPDAEHLALAQSDGCVLFTQDDEFLRLHAAGVAHAEIVYAPQGTSVGDVIRGLMLIHQLCSEHFSLQHEPLNPYPFSSLRPPTSNCTYSGCTEVLGPIEGLQSENRLHRLEVSIAVNQGDLVFHRDRGDQTIRC